MLDERLAAAAIAHVQSDSRGFAAIGFDVIGSLTRSLLVEIAYDDPRAVCG
jgi:hypothetical protein